jgi:Pyridoxamine 5'-phosphate oxidase
MANRNPETTGSSLDPADIARVQEAFDRSEIMALSTVDSEAGSWTVPLQYQWDRRLHLFFSSLPRSRHVDNLGKDNRVSIAIYSFPGPPGGNLGLQLTGTARALDEHESTGGWLRFEVTPLGIWYFDSRADRHRHEVDLELLQRAMGEASDAGAQGSQQ